MIVNGEISCERTINLFNVNGGKLTYADNMTPSETKLVIAAHFCRPAAERPTAKQLARWLEINGDNSLESMNE